MRLRFASLIAVLWMMTGCAGKPCETSSECGTGAVCLSQRCQAVTCSPTSVYYAVDPATAECRPLPMCGNDDSVRSWKSCDDPCSGEAENVCIFDPRCQPVYTEGNTSSAGTGGGTVANIPPCAQTVPGASGEMLLAGDCGAPERVFAGCRPNPLPINPCAGKSRTDCANDSRCAVEAVGCDCPAGSTCACPAIPPSPTPVLCNCTNSTAPCECDLAAPAPTAVNFECRQKICGDYTDTECAQHQECTLLTVPVPLPAGAGSADAGVNTTPRSTFSSCASRFSGCASFDEATCLAHPECHPVGTNCYCPALASCACSGGGFQFCEPDDGLHRCASDSDCGGGERCSNDEQCAPPIGQNVFPANAGSADAPSAGLGTKVEPVPPAPCPGLCVPKGCAGDGEVRCNADPACQPIYTLNCTPYGSSIDANGTAPPCVFNGQGGSSNVACQSMCQPTFSGCTDVALVSGDPGTVDPERTVLLRDPVVVDDPAFAFATVMSALAGGGDATPFVNAWLSQLTTQVSVGTTVVAPRPGAIDYLSTLPHRADGLLDLSQLQFQVTSLSNRIDLAGPNDCGEARITYALAGGLSDSRHRMTVIVELRQPDDGFGCAATAKRWLTLGSLSGDGLTAGARAIYAPLLFPALLNQVRTNEFLVGSVPHTNPSDDAWQLREWRLGQDGQLHLSPSKQALNPKQAETPAFADWLSHNQLALTRQAVVIPDQFLAATSSEDGSRIDPAVVGPVADPLNQIACAGCHTTETTTAFAHVAERFQGTGRAQISTFLRELLPVRATHLVRVSEGRLDLNFRAQLKPVH